MIAAVIEAAAVLRASTSCSMTAAAAAALSLSPELMSGSADAIAAAMFVTAVARSAREVLSVVNPAMMIFSSSMSFLYSARFVMQVGTLNLVYRTQQKAPPGEKGLCEIAGNSRKGGVGLESRARWLASPRICRIPQLVIQLHCRTRENDDNPEKFGLFVLKCILAPDIPVERQAGREK